MNNQDGGKKIGEGTYGCVYKPALLCDGDSKRQPDTVSKFMNKEEAKKEIEEMKNIHKIDPSFRFHIDGPSDCKNPQFVPSIDGNMRDCKNVSAYNKHTYTGLNYKYGGIELSEFFEKNRWTERRKYEDSQKMFTRFFCDMSNIIHGLKIMSDSGYGHFDIKPANVLVLEGKNKNRFNLIDFGLSGYFDKYKSDIFSFPYPFWPNDVIYLEDKSLVNKSASIQSERLSYPYESKSKDYFKHFITPRGFKKLMFMSPLDVQVYKDYYEKVSPETFHKDNISQIDTYSVGLLFVQAWKYFTGYSFDYGSITPSEPIVMRILGLINHMLHPIFVKRITPTDLVKEYELLFNELEDKPKKRIKLKPLKIKKLQKEPSIKEILEDRSMSKTKKKTVSKKKECPPDKVLNPSTNRCISKKGATAKKLKLVSPTQKKTQKQIQIIIGKKQRKAVANKTRKNCPPSKVMNPKTKRCINKSGVTARKLKL
jgi:serine/threonine protein kinase